jgi:hypothetical protein
VKRFAGIGGLSLLLVIALAAMAVGYALWSKTITINSTVQTGNVHAAILDAFTDDDNVVDNADLDSMDTGDCPIHVGDPAISTSCDPAETGADPKRHYDKDVAQCFAEVDADDDNIAHILKMNVYPSYHCTAWLQIENDGSIPVKIVSVEVNGQPVEPSVPTPFDLGGNSDPDVSVHITDVEQCAQIEPGEKFFMNVDQHVLQGAPQDATLGYTVEVLLAQWNEAHLFGCVEDKIIDADGIATAGDGLGTCGSPVTAGAVQVAYGDPLTSWPTGFDPDDHGIDILEGVVDDAWTSTCSGDDIHLEGSACPTGVRDGDHDLGEDCKLLDYDGSLVDGQAVDCDLESGSFCTGSLLTDLVFFDANGDGYYDNGEDIVIDSNGNGFFD